MPRIKGTVPLEKMGPPPGPVSDRCKADCSTCGAPAKGSKDGRCRFCKASRATRDAPNSW